MDEWIDEWTISLCDFLVLVDRGLGDGEGVDEIASGGLEKLPCDDGVVDDVEGADAVILVVSKGDVRRGIGGEVGVRLA